MLKILDENIQISKPDGPNTSSEDLSIFLIPGNNADISAYIEAYTCGPLHQEKHLIKKITKIKIELTNNKSFTAHDYSFQMTDVSSIH